MVTLFSRLMCVVGWHDWDVFSMRRFDGGLDWFRCCMRCERSEALPLTKGGLNDEELG